MSTNTNGSATKSSGGTFSNKRPRNADGGLASTRTGNRPPQEVSVKRKPKHNPTPYNTGIAKADTYIVWLHTGTHNVLSESACNILGAYAAYYRAFTKYKREKKQQSIHPQRLQI